jgi:hypothetical protein
MERVQAWRHFEAQRRARMLGRGAAAATAVLQHGDLARAVSEHLVPLGIESCYLAILDPSGSDRAGRTARLVLAYHAHDERAALRPDGFSYPAGEILPYAMMTPGRRVAYVVAELGLPGGEQALLVVDLGQPEGYTYEALRHVFGATLAGVRLGERLREEQAAARAEDRGRAAAVASARDAVAAAMERCRALAGGRGDLGRELGALQGLLQVAQDDLDRILALDARPD